MSTTNTTAPFLIRHLRGESLGRFPVWLMRQAGRYLPAYRAVREKHTFWEMVTRPELAAEVSLQPLEYLKIDAVIFFSDILTLPYGQGLPIGMKESIGPVVENPLRTAKAFEVFHAFDPAQHTRFVSEALRQIKAKLPADKTLIGFAGSPWTVGCYLIEGQGKNGFPTIQKWMNEDPSGLIRALTPLSRATARYLKSQVEAGAQLLQLFDTWMGSMTVPFFREYYRPLLVELLTEMKATGVPVTYFGKGAAPFLAEMNGLPADVLGVEPTLSLRAVDVATGGEYSLQGNFSPEALFAETAEVRKSTRFLVQEARKLKRPAILNLGHGVLPKTPVENVQAFVEEARSLWL